MKNNQIVLFEIFYKRFRNIKETTSRLALEIYIEVYEPNENTVLLNKIIKFISITRHKYKKIELCMVQKLVESDVEGMKLFRSIHPKVFLGKGILKICSKFTGEHPYRSVISIQLLCNFIEVAL